MNLSQIIEQAEVVEAPIERFQLEEARLVRIVEAIDALSSSKEWSTLKTEILDESVQSLTKELLDEAQKDEPKPLKLNRLSGELKWVKRFADIKKWGEGYRLQLTGLKRKLNDTV